MNASIDALIASNVRAEIARRGIPQAEAARSIGLGGQAFRRRAAGEVPFTAAELIGLAEAFEIRLVTLLPDRHAA